MIRLIKNHPSPGLVLHTYTLTRSGSQVAELKVNSVGWAGNIGTIMNCEITGLYGPYMLTGTYEDIVLKVYADDQVKPIDVPEWLDEVWRA